MRFTILSHAGMLVEAGGTKLVSDPWILGSCYWRSWWNYPRPAKFSTDGVEYIYLTHMHWDHFHGPSLRRFSPDVTYLVPKAPTACLLKDLASFPCKEIIELPHGKLLELRPGLRLTSYHFGLNTDSSLVIEDRNTTLVNMNDCKLAGRALEQLIRRHPKIDFLFRSHSSAQPYPTCVETEDPLDLRFRDSHFYVADFAESAALMKPRFAVPFASNNCFLHRETRAFNDAVVNPIDVKAYFDLHNRSETECAVMVAGDSWDDSAGFAIQEQDFFTNREKHLREYAQEIQPLLEATYRKEDNARIEFAAFEKYFQQFLKSLPWFSPLLIKSKVVFEVEGRANRQWVVDFAKKRVYEADGDSRDWHLRYRVHPAVLRDCVRRNMFTLLFPSKRLRVEVRRGRLQDYFAFEQLFDLYEYGLLPTKNCFSARSLAAWMRRWREVLHMAGLAARATLHFGGNGAVETLMPKTSL